MSTDQQLNRVFDLTMLGVATAAAFVSYRVAPHLVPQQEDSGRFVFQLFAIIPVVLLPAVPLALVAQNQGWFASSRRPPQEQGDTQRNLFAHILLWIVQAWLMICLFGLRFLDFNQAVSASKLAALLCGLFVAGSFFLGAFKALFRPAHDPPDLGVPADRNPRERGLRPLNNNR